MKRIQLEPWTPYDRLSLASAVLRTGDQNWNAVARATRNIFEESTKYMIEEKRSSEWFSTKQCAAQYEALLKNIGPRRKKKSEKTGNEHIGDSPTEIILNAVRQECIEELKRSLASTQTLYLKLHKEYEDIQAGKMDHKLEEMLEEYEAKEREKEIKMKLKFKLGEKNPEIMENSTNSVNISEEPEIKKPNQEKEQPPPLPPPPPPPPPSEQAKTNVTTSPLLTSLLQSPSPLTRPSLPSNASPTISLLLNSSPSVPTSDSPTLTKLLETSTSVAGSPLSSANASAVPHVTPKQESIPSTSSTSSAPLVVTVTSPPNTTVTATATTTTTPASVQASTSITSSPITKASTSIYSSSSSNSSSPLVTPSISSDMVEPLPAQSSPVATTPVKSAVTIPVVSSTAKPSETIPIADAVTPTPSTSAISPNPSTSAASALLNTSAEKITTSPVINTDFQVLGDVEKIELSTEETKPEVVEENKEILEIEVANPSTPEIVLEDIVHSEIESEVVIGQETPVSSKKDVARKLDLDQVEETETDEEVMETVEQIIEKVEEAIIETVGEESTEIDLALNQSSETDNLSDNIETLELDSDAVELIVLGHNQGKMITIRHDTEISSDPVIKTEQTEEEGPPQVESFEEDIENIVEEEVRTSDEKIQEEEVEEEEEEIVEEEEEEEEDDEEDEDDEEEMKLSEEIVEHEEIIEDKLDEVAEENEENVVVGEEKGAEQKDLLVEKEKPKDNDKNKKEEVLDIVKKEMSPGEASSSEINSPKVVENVEGKKENQSVSKMEMLKSIEDAVLVETKVEEEEEEDEEDDDDDEDEDLEEEEEVVEEALEEVVISDLVEETQPSQKDGSETKEINIEKTSSADNVSNSLITEIKQEEEQLEEVAMSLDVPEESVDNVPVVIKTEEVESDTTSNEVIVKEEIMDETANQDEYYSPTPGNQKSSNLQEERTSSKDAIRTPNGKEIARLSVSTPTVILGKPIRLDKEHEEQKVSVAERKASAASAAAAAAAAERHEIEKRRTGRKRYPLAGSADSKPNSPAPSSHSMEDDREYKAWKKSIMLVYNRLAAHKYASVFLKPITEAEATGYRNVVLRPMDLTTIKRNIETGVIRSTVEFQRDMILMAQNAMIYNKVDSLVFKMAEDMLADMMSQMEVMVQALGDGVPLWGDSDEKLLTRGRASKAQQDENNPQKRRSQTDDTPGRRRHHQQQQQHHHHQQQGEESAKKRKGQQEDGYGKRKSEEGGGSSSSSSSKKRSSYLEETSKKRSYEEPTGKRKSHLEETNMKKKGASHIEESISSSKKKIHTEDSNSSSGSIGRRKVDDTPSSSKRKSTHAEDSGGSKKVHQYDDTAVTPVSGKRKGIVTADDHSTKRKGNNDSSSSSSSYIGKRKYHTEDTPTTSKRKTTAEDTPTSSKRKSSHVDETPVTKRKRASTAVTEETRSSSKRKRAD